MAEPVNRFRHGTVDAGGDSGAPDGPATPAGRAEGGTDESARFVVLPSSPRNPASPAGREDEGTDEFADFAADLDAAIAEALSQRLRAEGGTATAAGVDRAPRRQAVPSPLATPAADPASVLLDPERLVLARIGIASRVLQEPG